MHKAPLERRQALGHVGVTQRNKARAKQERGLAQIARVLGRRVGIPVSAARAAVDEAIRKAVFTPGKEPTP